MEHKDNTVIVLDNSNYKSYYAEKVPFIATVKEIYNHEVVVVSLETGKEYELYFNQVLEFLSISEIKQIVSLENYGKLENFK